MPLFNNSSSNILPEVDTNEIPYEEPPKPDYGKRRLSLKKSIFNWSSQRQYIDKNKFSFDSCSVIPEKDKKHSSIILKSNKYSTSHSHTSINYDESENEYSSGSDLNENEENSSKDFYSMEDLDNITALKTKPPKVVKVAPLSESTLCYSSNTNTINTVSLEFNGKNKLNDVIEGETINYGFEENPNIEETNNGYTENPNNEDPNNEEINNKNDENSINNLKKGNDNYNSSDDESSEDNDGSNDELSELNKNYSYVRKPSRPMSSSTKKTVTFCEDIVIIEPKRNSKTKNIFKRAISKIIKKRDELDKEVI